MKRHNMLTMQADQDIRETGDAGRCHVVIDKQHTQLPQEANHSPKKSCKEIYCDSKNGKGFCFKCVEWR
jgi:hypothetical protein